MKKLPNKTVDKSKSKFKISRSELLIEGSEDLVKWGISVVAVLAVLVLVEVRI